MRICRIRRVRPLLVTWYDIISDLMIFIDDQILVKESFFLILAKKETKDRKR